VVAQKYVNERADPFAIRLFLENIPFVFRWRGVKVSHHPQKSCANTADAFAFALQPTEGAGG
jgi:hypothetical protein